MKNANKHFFALRFLYTNRLFYKFFNKEKFIYAHRKILELMLKDFFVIPLFRHSRYLQLFSVPRRIKSNEEAYRHFRLSAPHRSPHKWV